jgi:hypothetical protein
MEAARQAASTAVPAQYRVAWAGPGGLGDGVLGGGSQARAQYCSTTTPVPGMGRLWALEV